MPAARDLPTRVGGCAGRRCVSLIGPTRCVGQPIELPAGFLPSVCLDEFDEVLAGLCLCRTDLGPYEEGLATLRLVTSSTAELPGTGVVPPAPWPDAMSRARTSTQRCGDVGSLGSTK